MRSFSNILIAILVLSGLTSQAQTARVQVIHNSADAAAATVDVWLDNTLLLDDFNFRSASPFVNAPAGAPIEIRIKGPGSTDTTNPIAKFTYTLASNETYIIVANGIVSGSGYTPATPFNLDVMAMGRETATNGSNTDVLVYHGSTDAPTVDVAEVDVANATVVDDLSYSEFQGYLELPTADYVLQVLDDNGTAPVAAYSAPLNTLNLQGAALTVLASGFLDPSQNSGGPAFGLFAALPGGGALVPLPTTSNRVARTQIIHNSADVAAQQVDIYINESLVLDDFEFRNASPFIDIAAGVPFDVTIQPSSSTDTTNALYSARFTLMDQEKYVIVADGIVSASGYNPPEAFNLSVYAGAREAANDPSNVDVLVHHGATDAGTVDVAETSAVKDVLIDNLAYEEFRGYSELPSNDYHLQLLNESGTQTIAAFDAPLSTLGLQGGAAIVVASGFVNPSNNSNGAAFGLYAALPGGGALVPLPSANNANAGVQVIHNSADTAAQSVDVWLNDELLLDNFEFRTSTPFVQLPAEVPVRISIAGPNSTDTAGSLAQYDYTLEAGNQYSIIANGIVSPSGYNPVEPFNLYVFEPARAMANQSGNTDVLVFHGATDAPVVDVAETGVGAGTIVDNLAYGDFQGYLELGTANYQLTVQDETGGTDLFIYDAPLNSLGLQDSALIVLASGFVDPSQNSDGAGFGLYVALPGGGAFIPLPLFTSIEERVSSLAEFRVAPNPASDQLYVEFAINSLTNIQYELVNMNGQIVRAEDLGSLQSGNHYIELAVGDLANGTYLLSIQDNNGRAVRPVVISR